MPLVMITVATRATSKAVQVSKALMRNEELWSNKEITDNRLTGRLKLKNLEHGNHLGIGL